MKKYGKRVKAAVMALLLAVSMLASSITVLAADTPTTKIVVSGIEEGADVYAYAIAIDAVDANGNHYWKYNPAGNVEQRVKDGDLSTEDMIYFYTHLNENSDQPDPDNANWNDHDGKGDATVDETVLTLAWDASTQTYSVDNVKPGLYVISANKQTKEYSYSGNVVAVNYQYSGSGIASIADENGVINVTAKKTSDPVVKKEIVENKSTYKHGDAMIGDVVDFQITLTFPAYGSAWQTDNLHFQIVDNLSEGLTLKEDTVKVEGTSISTLFDSGKKCTKTNISTGTNSFKLDLYGQDAWQYSEQTVKITYQATVNEKAKVNFDNDENKVTIKYSTTAAGTDMSDPMTDSTYHYTFGIDTLVNGSGSSTTTELTKYGVKTTTEINNKVPLDGAQFQLSDSKGKKLHFTEDGQYTTDETKPDYVTSKNNGQLVMTGLDAGTYTLKESKAPLGYALDKTEYTVTITPTYNDVTGELKNYTVTVNGGTNSITFTHEKQDNGTVNSTDNAADADTFGIVNTPLITLPETGGAGIIVLTVAAAVVMALSGSAFIFLGKKKKTE